MRPHARRSRPGDSGLGFYLRKSFRAGPIRFNLSKSGIGASVGVTGARVGLSSQGRAYVHGGRGGISVRSWSLTASTCAREYASSRARVTSRRVALVHQGVTSFPIGKIIDVEVDHDRQLLVLTRDNLATPTCLTTPDALRAGAIVAALTEKS